MYSGSFALSAPGLDAPDAPKFQIYQTRNFRRIPQLEGLPEELKFAVDVVSQVLPFRVNQFVLDELIDWRKVPDDPMFRLTFPHREMLRNEHFEVVANALRRRVSPHELQPLVEKIRMELNPHPAGQM